MEELAGFLSSARKRLCAFIVELWEKYNSLLVAACGMNNNPSAGSIALIGRGARHIRWDVDLLALTYLDGPLDFRAEIDDALSLQQIRDRFNATMEMNLCSCPGGIRRPGGRLLWSL